MACWPITQQNTFQLRCFISNSNRHFPNSFFSLSLLPNQATTCCPFYSHFPYLLVCLMDPYLSFRTQLKCQLFCGSSEDEHILPLSVMPHYALGHFIAFKIGSRYVSSSFGCGSFKDKAYILFRSVFSTSIQALEQRRIAS